MNFQLDRLDFMLFFLERVERRFVFVILKIKTYGFTYVMSAEVLVTFKLDLLVRSHLTVQNNVGGILDMKLNILELNKINFINADVATEKPKSN